MGKNATIVDIARDAGCSINTVSRALNNMPGVSAASRTRVLTSARRLGYVPSRIARSLLTKRTRTLGVIVTDCTNPFYARLIRAIDDTALRFDYSVVLCNSSEEHEREVRAVQLLIESRVDGILITPVQFSSKHILDLIKRNIPFVLMGRRFPDLDTCYVTSDNQAGAREATSLLLSLGHRRIGHVTGRLEISSVQERLAGYRETLTAYGVEFDESLVARAERDVEGGRECARRLLALSPRPSAIFAYNDLQALGVMQAARELDLRVPKDLAVVGYDNIELSALLEVPLTTVAQPSHEIGRAGATLLFRLIEGGDVAPEERTVVLAPQLVIRASSGEAVTM